MKYIAYPSFYAPQNHKSETIKTHLCFSCAVKAIIKYDILVEENENHIKKECESCNGTVNLSEAD